MAVAAGDVAGELSAVGSFGLKLGFGSFGAGAFAGGGAAGAPGFAAGAGLGLAGAADLGVGGGGMADEDLVGLLAADSEPVSWRVRTPPSIARQSAACLGVRKP